MKLKQKPMPQCHILLEHCVPTSSSTRFFKVIHRVIYFHEHKVQDHHRTQNTSHLQHINKRVRIHKKREREREQPESKMSFTFFFSLAKFFTYPHKLICGHQGIL